MEKKTVITISLLFVCLGLVDLITTVYGFSLGLIEIDGIFIPFGFTILSITCLLISSYIVNKGVVQNFTDKIIAIWFFVLSCFPVINNLFIIGSVI